MPINTDFSLLGNRETTHTHIEDVYLLIHFQKCHIESVIVESVKIKQKSKCVKMIQIIISDFISYLKITLLIMSFLKVVYSR